MEGTGKDTAFSGWLRGELDAQGMSVRGLARRVAERDYPDGATNENVESVRRQLNKYLREGRVPSPPMKRSIAGALETDPDEIPDEPDGDPISRLMADPSTEALWRDPEFRRRAAATILYLREALQ